MKILCAYSGLEYTVEHIPAYSQGTGEVHPVFSIPQKKLFSLLPKWAASELTPTDSYLLFLALLNSTDLIRWSCSAKRTEQTDQLIANNMSNLASMVGKMNAIKHPAFALPTFAVTAETRTLANIKYWIQIWETQYNDFLSGLKDSELREKLNRREAALERLIKNPSINPAKYAGMLASWAAEAGQFPLFRMQSPVSGQNTTCCEYWKDIIIRCYKSESIISIPKQDLQELLDHCEEYIEAGSIFSHHLFSTLKEGRDRQNNFLGIDFSVSLSAANPGFRILQPDDSVEDAALQLILDTAPLSEPRRSDYPTAFAFLRAKLKWDTASKYRKEAALASELEALAEATEPDPEAEAALAENEPMQTPAGEI